MFLPPAEECVDDGIAQRLQQMYAVERGVEEPGASGSKELAVVFVESSDQRVFQDSADLLIDIEGQIVDAHRGFPRLLYGKILS